jgi:ubiquinone/menaquinone biosynthesis C-methylase UbiE
MWYGIFSVFYDRALEAHYRPYRKAANNALRLNTGDYVLDLPCGTGQSFDAIVSAIGPSGRLLAIDRSRGMLARARRRVQRAGWENVRLERAAAEELHPDLIAGALGRPRVDAVICSIGLTALPEWEHTFARMFDILRPGGRMVLFDVYAAERSRQTKAVELMARADLSRKAWLPLEEQCIDFKREVLPADPGIFGGELYVASGTRP